MNWSISFFFFLSFPSIDHNVHK